MLFVYDLSHIYCSISQHIRSSRISNMGIVFPDNFWHLHHEIPLDFLKYEPYDVPNIPRCWSCSYHSTIVSFCVNNYLCILSDVQYLLIAIMSGNMSLFCQQIHHFIFAGQRNRSPQGRIPVLPLFVGFKTIKSI
jgi:hypothetical protein